MNEQFIPIKNEESTNQTAFKEVEEVQPPKRQIVMPQTNEEIISSLPEWNLEPPVEVNRGLS